MASSLPFRHYEGVNTPEEASNSPNDTGNISFTISDGQEQAIVENDAPLPVIESTRDDDDPDGSGAGRQFSGEISPGSPMIELATPDQTKVNKKLIDAAWEGDLDALKEAIKSGADTTATDSNGETALHKACRAGKDLIVEELLKDQNVLKSLRQGDAEGWTPLISACSEDHPGTKNIVRMLLQEDNNFDINQISTDTDRSALNTACLVSSEEVVKLLMNKKPDVNIPDHRGYTPLSLACRYFSTDIVRLLLDAGADYDAVDEDGNTPLILASQYGVSDTVAKILEFNPKTWKEKNKEGNDVRGGALLGIDALASAMLNLNARDQIIPLLLKRGLQLSEEDAQEFFSHGTSEKASGSVVQQSKWLKVVQAMMKSNTLPNDVSLHEAVEPILRFARKEEKVFALLNADTKEHFDSLGGLTADLGLNMDICNLIWASGHGRKEVQSLQRVPRLKTSAQEMLNTIERSAKSKHQIIPKPETQLQWSAYYGERDLVLYLLKISQSMDKQDIRKSLAIAKARKPTDHIEGKKDSTQSKGDEHDMPNSNTSSRNFERTIDTLTNATTLVSLPNKLPERPEEKQVKKREPLLQKHYASIVDFYDTDSQINLLRSSPSVFELIYSEGDDKVNDIMKKAKQIGHDMASGEASLPIDEENTVPVVNERETPRLRWIHLPANNMDWMEHLTLRIYDSKKEDQDRGFKDSFFDLARRSRDELPTDTSETKFMRPICLREAGETFRQGKTKQRKKPGSKTTGAGSPRLALYVPYVTFGYCYQSGGNSSNEKQKQLTKEYEQSILHGPRSLDRFYYNALPKDKMQERDGSQVVTRGLLGLEVGQSLPEGREKWPYLSVDQLWLWVIDNETIITSSTHRDDGFDDLLVDQIFEQLVEGSQKSMGQKPPTSATEMSHFLVGTCVAFINNLTWGHVCDENEENFDNNAISKPILLWYEESLNNAAAKEKELFADLKKRIEAEEKKRIKANHNEMTDDNCRLSAEALKNIKIDWTAIKVAATLLDEVKDIRDELTILRFLVTQQERVWEGLIGPKLAHRDARSPVFTAHELDDMIKMTDTIQSSIKDLLNLNLVDKSAAQSENLVELGTKSQEQSKALVDLGEKSQQQSETLVVIAKKAQQQNDQNAKQEKVLFAFAVVTVIFTPMSFMTSILALNTSTSRHNDDGELEWEPAFLYWMIFGVSAAIVAPFLGYAFLHKVKKFLLWLITSAAWVSCRIGLMYTKIAKSVREDTNPESRRSGDIEQGQTTRNNTSGTPSDTQLK